MEYPNMEPEVIDAIHLMYEDNPDVEADCYLYLQSLKYGANKENRISSLANAAYIELSNRGRCPECGGLMETVSYKERHNEISPGTYEIMHVTYCPNCDVGEL